MNYLQTPLFKNITENEYLDMKSKNFTKEKTYGKSEFIFHAGDIISTIGLVIFGQALIRHIDLCGNEIIISHIGEGQIFAESYALCSEPMMVNVVSEDNTTILFLNTDMFTGEANINYSWYPKMLSNLLNISVRKNLMLSDRIFCTGPRTIRSRLMIYLSSQSARAGSLTFSIPFNRQQMADYLNVDRSALSKELCKMRDEGIITFHKNHFHIISNAF